MPISPLSFVTISLTLFSGGCSNVPVWEQGLASKSNMTFEDSAVFDYGAQRLHDRHTTGVHIVPLNETKRKPTLFFVHGWGGHLFHFVQLVRRLNDHFSVFGIQNYLRDDAEPDSFDALISHYADLLQRHQPDGPYHIGGFSLGGLFAFALATELRRRGAAVRSVLIIDSEPGNLPWIYHVRIQTHLMIRLLPMYLRHQAKWTDLLNPAHPRRQLHRLASVVGLCRPPPKAPHVSNGRRHPSVAGITCSRPLCGPLRVGPAAPLQPARHLDHHQRNPTAVNQHLELSESAPRARPPSGRLPPRCHDIGALRFSGQRDPPSPPRPHEPSTS